MATRRGGSSSNSSHSELRLSPRLPVAPSLLLCPPRRAQDKGTRGSRAIYAALCALLLVAAYAIGSRLLWSLAGLRAP
jgi:hypothetical protein